MARLLDDCRDDRLCLGTLIQDTGTLVMSTLGKAGFSFVFLDMMYGTLDWSDIRPMTTAARAAGLTSVVRIQNYPWGKDEPVPDRRIVADASRVMALGADGVRCSVSDASDVRRLAAITKDWHRVPDLPNSALDFEALEKEAQTDIILMPIIESVRAYNDLEEIMSMPEVNTVMISGTDLPRQLFGISLDYENPNVWQFLDDAVALGHKYDVAIGFNSGYSYHGLDETASRVERISEHGVGFILIQTLDHIVYSYTSSLVSIINSRARST